MVKSDIIQEKLKKMINFKINIKDKILLIV